MKLRRKRVLIGVLLLLAILAIIWLLGLSQEQQNNVIDESQNLFPFGEIQSGDTININSEQNESEVNESQSDSEIDEEGRPLQPKLRKVTTVPTAGFSPIIEIGETVITNESINEEGELVSEEIIVPVRKTQVRYIEVARGAIKDAELTPYDMRHEDVVENNIPNIEEAVFTKNGEEVAMRFLDITRSNIETYTGQIIKKQLDVKPCPFSLNNSIDIDSTGEGVFDLHRFLNRSSQTTVSASGPNSPGNEGSVATEDTITAIKNFQVIHGLDIDGVTGPTTREKMQEICANQQQILAQKAFEKIEEKYIFDGRFILRNVLSIAMHPSESLMFYLYNNANETRGVIRDIKTGIEEPIFTSPLLEIKSLWSSPDNIEIATKPSYLAPTYTYNMDPSTGDFHKSLRESEGMTTLPSPDGNLSLISLSNNDNVQSFIFSKSLNQTIPLNISTLTDKCTWSETGERLYCGVPRTFTAGGRYPDTWYQGLEFFIDSIYQINAENLQETLIVDIPAEYSEEIDIESIDVDENEEYLYFIDKQSEHLWSYRLSDI